MHIIEMNNKGKDISIRVKLDTLVQELLFTCHICLNFKMNDRFVTFFLS